VSVNLSRVNWGAVSAVVALLAIAAYHFLTPMPGEAPAQPKKTSVELEDDKKQAMEKLDETERKINAVTWQVSQDEVGPTAMAWVSARARENFVEVKAFRPQRSADGEGLVQLNYLVTAEGPFLNVMRLIDDFEAQGSLLAVRTVQIASLDGSSDAVRATIALVAYREAQSGG
jgi:hypothetical protein